MYQALATLLLGLIQFFYDKWERARALKVRIRAAQTHKAERADLLLQGKGEELSSMDRTRNLIIRELFRVHEKTPDPE